MAQRRVSRVRPVAAFRRWLPTVGSVNLNFRWHLCDGVILPVSRRQHAYSSARLFTCTLSNLDGGGEPNEHQAMLINSSLASGRRYGFVFKLSECSGAPATTFQLTAAPNQNVYGRKAFCADQSGVIRSSEDGNPATCFASGTPIP
jgi:hypothetical protein